MKLAFHPIANAFPMLEGAAFDQLKASIRKDGLHHEITLYEEKILDGRNRYNACVALGIDPTFTTYLGTDPVAFVLAENSYRRHLTPSQLAMAGTNLREYEAAKAKERQQATQIKPGREMPRSVSRDTDLETGYVRQAIAKEIGVGEASVQRAIYVRDKGIPELAQAVESGDMTVNMAAKIAKLNPDAQRAILSEPKDVRRVAIREAENRSHAARNRAAIHAIPSGHAYPGTSFIRKILQNLDSLLIVCAEEKCRTAQEIADRFNDEMDWDAPGLVAQYERVHTIFQAWGLIVRTHKERTAA